MKNLNARTFPEIFDAFVGLQLPVETLTISGNESLPAWFEVTELAVESIAVAGLLLQQRAGIADQAITVDRRLASLWFDKSICPNGWELPPAWDSIAGNYLAQDCWVRLHTNAPLHKQAALSVLGCEDNREKVAALVEDWSAHELAEAVIEAGGCAATMRSLGQWKAHPQGQAVSSEPLIHWDLCGQEVNKDIPAINHARPLEGIKVLDLTRILAGPIATRFLAGYGAEVLRIDPLGWDEPSTAPEVTLGKRCAGLDLKSSEGKVIFEKLLKQADLLVHGYRPGALAGLGYDSAELRRINPRLVDVSLSAYGWTGPWSQRRGFDSVVQMACGIAEYGMSQASAKQPVALPVQGLDHATGYLIAAAAIHGLNCRDNSGEIYSARLSLARTASLLMTQASSPSDIAFAEQADKDLGEHIEFTEWGEARRVKFPLGIQGTPAKWQYPASSLHSVSPKWA